MIDRTFNSIGNINEIIKINKLLKVFDILVGLVGAPMTEARISTIYHIFLPSVIIKIRYCIIY